MKVFDILKSMDIDEFAEWLNKYGAFDCSPWNEWWEENHCNKCEPIESIGESIGGWSYKVKYGYCELNGNCKFFKNMDDIPNNKQVIKMWLESEDCLGNAE